MADPQSPRRQRATHPSTTTLKALGQAAGEVAHDLDNALSAILTHATLLRSTAAAPASLAHVDAIIRATKVASDIVERVRGRLRERPERALSPIDLGALVDDALVVARARAAPRAIEITRAGTCPGPVAGQPAELLQLVTNLVNNAVDASDPGGQVAVVLARDPSGAARIEVHDRGPGIPPALRERVFEPFFTTKGQAGSGLGLALARSIAASHGGTLVLDSRLHDAPAATPSLRSERGTTAIVTLPLADPSADLRPAVATALELDGLAADATVLIVDDDDNMRSALSLLFVAAGFRAHTAASFDAALATFAAEPPNLANLADPPDLVITDLQLGPDSGAALVLELARVVPGLPIIVASGAVAAHDGAWREHAAAVFDKPVSPGRLIAKARELIAQRRARQAP